MSGAFYAGQTIAVIEQLQEPTALDFLCMEKKHRSTARKRLCSFFSEVIHRWAKQRRLTLCRLGSALLFSLLAGLPLAAQETRQRQPDPPADERAMQKTAPPSPYLIETLIDINEEIDLKRIWQMLDIAPPTAGAYRCDGGCEADTFDIATSGEDHKRMVALKISHKNGHFYEYLIFKQADSGAREEGAWRLLGKIDCFDQRDGSPGHRVEQGDGRTWLVIKEAWGQRAGPVVYGEAWHEIQDNAVKRVLAYPVEGHDAACRNQPGASFKSMLLRHDLENGTYTIPVQFMVAYEVEACGSRDAALPLFAKGLKARYVWNAAQGRFVLDEARSDVTAGQVARFAYAQPFSDAAFVEDNFHELAEIATSGDARRKAWLRNFLGSMPDTPRVADLRRLLQQ
jgi:hypothetical protein